MHIALHYTDGGGSQTLAHDLNFQSGERYEKPQTLTFRHPKPNLLRALQGGAAQPIRTDYENGSGTPKTKRPYDGSEKKSKKRRVVCHSKKQRNQQFF